MRNHCLFLGWVIEAPETTPSENVLICKKSKKESLKKGLQYHLFRPVCWIWRNLICPSALSNQQPFLYATFQSPPVIQQQNTLQRDVYVVVPLENPIHIWFCTWLLESFQDQLLSLQVPTNTPLHFLMGALFFLMIQIILRFKNV